MVEKSNVRESHCNIVFVASFDDVVVANGTARLRDKINAGLVSAFDIVAEWEKSIGR